LAPGEFERNSGAIDRFNFLQRPGELSGAAPPAAAFSFQDLAGRRGAASITVTSPIMTGATTLKLIAFPASMSEETTE
jgi:hypothetical protein